MTTIKKSSRPIVDPENKFVTINDLNKTKSELRNFAEQVKKDTASELEQYKKDFKDIVETDKISLISTFGIFASVISFLTIEIQFLKTIPSLIGIVGFSFILFSLLLGFNIGLDYLVKNKNDASIAKPNRYYIIAVTWLLLLGCVFLYLGHKEQRAQKEHEIASQV